ncbi:MAG TPA: ADP-ribosylglycohydrolase family protein, partial [Candidatus Binatia bacterium]|nr:ADP-ribosylglycohydrolase family protein [Candidatus Binatia bacterium]
MRNSPTGTLPPDYEHRVYAGWLGKCIGVRLGAPVENWTYEEIRDNLGEIRDYLPLPPGAIFKPDDDTALPMILIRALDEYGAEVTAEQIGRTWLNYIADQRGTLWWGGYGYSTEHTAYLNLANGVPAPQSGSIALNGPVLAEQIGGQIFSDIWGLVAPDDPQRAAHFAGLASSVSHDGNGLHGGRYIAALVSMAFSESDPRTLVQGGLAVIPGNSEYARVVRAVLDFHAARPGDWRAAYQFIKGNFGPDRYGGLVHIIPNAAIVVMALLYGAGDFSRTIQVAAMAGWDADCNVGNVGAVTGVAVGLPGIDERWREPLNDILVAASVSGARNLLDIPGCAALFARLGRQLAVMPTADPPARYHFDYPGATHGFTPDYQSAVVHVRQKVEGSGGVLQARIVRLTKKREARLFVRTYLRRAELSAFYYGVGFSPHIYPGQTVRARLFLPPGASEELRAALYVWDDNSREAHQAPGQLLEPGRWHDLSYKIPSLDGACLTRLGLVLRNVGAPWTGDVLLDDVDWHGSASFSFDFRQEREDDGLVSQWTVLRGFWRLHNGAYHGSGPGVNESYSGDDAWRDYSLDATLRPVIGDYHNINVRVRGS